MKKYTLVNNIAGWIVFAAAAITYLLTIEPTASLWDCGEFIATGYKLEVGHPPGNPVFMVIARFFTLFAGGDVTKVAAMVNAMSALASAFTVLFLFWTITHLARKLIIKGEEFTFPSVFAVIGAGLVGSVAFMFSDSFWFSAVEGEVYATSSLFTAMVFWAILKWENVAEEKHADRWIILIAFLMGLSIGVHLLNLLAIPAIVLVYYFRKFSFTPKGFAISLAVSFVILALLLFGIIPGIVTISEKTDIFFVNRMELPPNSGMVFHVVLLAIVLALAIRSTMIPSGDRKTALLAIASMFLAGTWVISKSSFLNILCLSAVSAGLWYAASRNRQALNLLLTSVAVILIGYSATAIIVIRSSANPPLNENNPSNPVNLLYYLNREQYGSRPLFSGAYYNAPPPDYEKGEPKYSLEGGKYKVTGYDYVAKEDPRFVTFFPRMWSEQEDHKSVYESWGAVRGTPVQITNAEGEKEVIRKPTFVENIRFMLTYQFGYMYFRYFMWNFSGRQNDTQGTGGAVNGNWITGINFLDKPRTGDYGKMPEKMKEDPSRNVYYLLPFILGMIGFIYHLNRDRRNWFNILLLFIMTGIAIVIYLNQYPNQPRERDYAYTGSFYFFTVWIGLGVLSVFEIFSRLAGRKVAAPLAVVLCFIAVPAIMGAENWDDHDRSGRYLARDVAANYLNSCAPNAILFTNGDNDTFPLWYAQEVEGVRTDVRVANLMLLNTEWYIDQMKRATYESAPLPVTLPKTKYYENVNNQVYIYEQTKEPVGIKTVIEWVMSDLRSTKLQVSATEMLDVIPSRIIRIPVDARKVIESGVVKPEDSALIVPYIDIKLRGSYILKSQLIVLDILAHNDWKRPVYFVTGYHDDAMGLEEYFQLEGIAYRLVPIRSANRSWMEYGRIDTDILYENIMNRFTWRGANDEDVFIDYNHSRTLSVIKARFNHARLAKALIAEGKNEKALEVLDRCMVALPLSNVPYDPYVGDLIEAYFAAGAADRAAALATGLTDHYSSELDYYLSQDDYILNSAESEIGLGVNYLSMAAEACSKYGKKELGDSIAEKAAKYSSAYMARFRPQGK